MEIDLKVDEGRLKEIMLGDDKVIKTLNLGNGNWRWREKKSFDKYSGSSHWSS